TLATVCHLFCHYICLYRPADIWSFPTRRSSDLGKSGGHYYDIVRGIHLSEVHPHRDRKSLSVETTFERDLFEREKLAVAMERLLDRKSTRLNSSHVKISYAVFCLKKKTSLLQWK